VVVMGQSTEALARGGVDVRGWEEAEAPARRRRWYVGGGSGTLAVLLASASDVDDLVPTLVAYQIEWNKIHLRMRAASTELSNALAATDSAPESLVELCARLLGGSID